MRGMWVSMVVIGWRHYLERAAVIVDDYDFVIRFFVGLLGVALIKDSPS